MKYKNLLCVKSIITIVFSIVFCVITCLYPDTYSETFKTVITTVVTFYFANQYNKNEKIKENESNGDNNPL